MIVSELIKRLQDMPQRLEVIISVEDEHEAMSFDVVDVELNRMEVIIRGE